MLFLVATTAVKDSINGINFEAVQFMSQILVGLTFDDCWGTFQLHSLEVQAGFVRPFRLAASTRKSKAVTCIHELLILK